MFIFVLRTFKKTIKGKDSNQVKRNQGKSVHKNFNLGVQIEQNIKLGMQIKSEFTSKDMPYREDVNSVKSEHSAQKDLCLCTSKDFAEKTKSLFIISGRMCGPLSRQPHPSHILSSIKKSPTQRKRLSLRKDSPG